MSLPRITFTSDDGRLLTFDGREVFAHDVATMELIWTLAIDEPVVAVARAHVVDASGTVHTIDRAAGKVTGSDGPHGAPAAFAAHGETLALAARDRILVWKGGVKTEIAQAATALAFSADEKRLAIGQAAALVTFDLEKNATTSTQKTEGRVTAVAPHWLADAWLYGLSTGIYTGTKRLSGGEVGAIAVDVARKRVAVARAETHVAVFRGGFDVPEMRIKYTDRKVRGLAVEGSTLAIGLDQGDANTVDVTSSTVARTARGGERTWSPEVDGQRERAEARASEERSVQEHEEKIAKGQIGTKAIVIAAILLAALIIVRMQRREAQSAPPPPEPAACDASCARQRLDFLVKECSDKPCAAKAEEVRTAFLEGRCEDASREADDVVNGLSGVNATRLAAVGARMGIAAACKAP